MWSPAMSAFETCFLCMNKLVELWRRYRVERPNFPEVLTLQRVDFRKGFYVEEWQGLYSDPRQPHNTLMRLALVQIPTQFALGADLAGFLRDHYVQLADHVVILRQRESKVAKILNEAGFIWETLGYDELAFDKLSHSLVPKYEILLSETEKDCVLRQLDLPSAQRLPRLLARVDPIARLLGLRVNDIVRIVRVDHLTLVNVAYRLVSAQAHE